MASITADTFYNLSNQHHYNNNKEFIYVKLTDSALRAIEDYIKNQVSIKTCYFFLLFLCKTFLREDWRKKVNLSLCSVLPVACRYKNEINNLSNNVINALLFSSQIIIMTLEDTCSLSPSLSLKFVVV